MITLRLTSRLCLYPQTLAVPPCAGYAISFKSPCSMDLSRTEPHLVSAAGSIGLEVVARKQGRRVQMRVARLVCLRIVSVSSGRLRSPNIQNYDNSPWGA